MKIYWICLHDTYIKREKNFPQDFEIVFSKPETLNNEKDYLCVVETEKFDYQVIETVSDLKAIFFCENFKINSSSFSVIEFLAYQGIPIFWCLDDLVNFLRISIEINRSFSKLIKNTNHLLNNEYVLHSFSVGNFSEKIALKLGFDKLSAQNIKIAGILHDIGKLCLPKSFIEMPKKFNDFEKYFISLHTIYGMNFLKNITDILNSEIYYIALDVVEHHHEKLDGSGYPKGLTAEEISVANKIISVADVYSALLNDRPYRSACDKDLALSYIQSKSGQWFNPEVVKILLNIENKEQNKTNCSYTITRDFSFVMDFMD